MVIRNLREKTRAYVPQWVSTKNANSSGFRKASVILRATVLGLRVNTDDLPVARFGEQDRADPRAFGSALTNRRKAVGRLFLLLAGTVEGERLHRSGLDWTTAAIPNLKSQRSCLDPKRASDPKDSTP